MCTANVGITPIYTLENALRFNLRAYTFKNIPGDAPKPLAKACFAYWLTTVF